VSTLNVPAFEKHLSAFDFAQWQVVAGPTKASVKVRQTHLE
jgi:hypothetical protein